MFAVLNYILRFIYLYVLYFHYSIIRYILDICWLSDFMLIVI